MSLLKNTVKNGAANLHWQRCGKKAAKSGVELAEKVLKAVEKPSEFKPLYKDEASLEEKIETVAKECLRCRRRNVFRCREERIKAH